MRLPTAVTSKVGLLVVNLGSPDAPEPAAVRRYLDQFLSDRRVVEIPPILWQPILKLFVLTLRPAKSAANYARIWDRESGESPLKRITRAQADALGGAFGEHVIVDWAMRYGAPSMADALDRLMAQGCDRICVAPLYPQYCGATTGSALDELFRLLSGRRALPAVRTLPPYADHPAYIGALKRSVERQLAALDFVPEKLLLSFHGMPARTAELGDPYSLQCLETARLLRIALGRDEASMPVAFQSRFGRARWLQPYVEPLLAELARGGTRRIAVLMPGFSADCIETLEEIGIAARETFLNAGGTHFAALTCLNAEPEGMAMLRTLLGEALAGWTV